MAARRLMGLLRRAADPNPVLVRELRVRLRGGRAFLLTALCATTASLCLVVPYGLASGRLAGRAVAQQELSDFSRQVCWVTFLSLLFLLDAILPGLLGGSVAMERSRRTFVQLLITRLSDRDIALGKMASALVPVALWSCTAVPVLCLTSLIGGVDVLDIAVGLLLCVSSALATASVCLLVSAETRVPLRGIVTSYFVVWAWRLGLPVLESALGHDAPWESGTGSMFLVPWVAAVAWASKVHGSGYFLVPLEGSWLVSTAVSLLVAFVFTAWASWRVGLMRALTREIGDARTLESG